MIPNPKKTIPQTAVVSVQHLLNELLACYGRVKKDHRTCFINDVPAQLVVPKDQLAPLLGDLFAIISTHPGHTPVYISAMGSDHQVKLFVKEPPFPMYCFPGSFAA